MRIGGAVLAAVMVLLTAVCARADGDTRGRWWQSPDIGQQLQLSEAEIQQLDDAFDASQLRMIELRSNVAIERSKLRALLEKPDLDEAAIMGQHQSELAARSLLSDARLAFMLEVRKILGQDRFIQLMEIRDLRRHRRHMETTPNSGTPK